MKLKTKTKQNKTQNLVVPSSTHYPLFSFETYCPLFFLLLLELRTEPKALRLLGKRPTTKLNPQPQLTVLNQHIPLLSQKEIHVFPFPRHRN